MSTSIADGAIFGFNRAQRMWRSPGRPPLSAATPAGPSTPSTTAYPNLTTHPGALWTRSGDWLTSTGRRRCPVFDATDDFRLGETEPTWSSSGCRLPLEALEVDERTTSFVTTADNQVISGKWFKNANIELRHKNVTVIDCITNVGKPDGRALIHGNCGVTSNPAYDTSGSRIIHVTVDAKNAGPGGAADSANVNGLYIISGFVWRCAIRGVTDAVAPDINAWSSEPSHVWGSYLETRWLPYDPEQSDGTHNDGIQFAGGDGNTAIGNSIHNPDGGVTDAASGFVVQGQCIVLTPYHAMPGTAGTRDAGQMSNTQILSNWLYGSYSMISAWLPYNEGGPGVPGLTIRGNRFGGKCKWPILLTPGAAAVDYDISGNVALAGFVWNNGAAATGSTVNPYVASKPDSVGITSNVNIAHAGNDQTVEAGRVTYLIGKGKTAANAWVKSGVWTQVSGPAVALTNASASDGTSYASFTPAKSAAIQTLVFRYTPTGMSAYEDVTITVAPWQTGGI